MIVNSDILEIQSTKDKVYLTTDKEVFVNGEKVFTPVQKRDFISFKEWFPSNLSDFLKENLMQHDNGTEYKKDSYYLKYKDMEVKITANQNDSSKEIVVAFVNLLNPYIFMDFFKKDTITQKANNHIEEILKFIRNEGYMDDLYLSSEVYCDVSAVISIEKFKVEFIKELSDKLDYYQNIYKEMMKML